MKSTESEVYGSLRSLKSTESEFYGVRLLRSLNATDVKSTECDVYGV